MTHSSTAQPIHLAPPPGLVAGSDPELEYWSNLTLRRISEHDAGQYKCVARNKGGQVESIVSLQTPPAPVTILIEEETGITYNTIIIIAVVVTVVLLVALSLLTVCLYRRSRKKNQQQRDRSSGLNGSLKQNGKAINGNGSLALGNGTGSGSNGGGGNEQEKSLLEIEMMDQSTAVIPMQDGYQAVAQTDVDNMQQLQEQYQQQQLIQQQHLRALGHGHGSSTYIPADRFDTSSPRLIPETLTRHLMMPDGTMAQVQQLPDGSFYPDLLDIPHRGARGGGSPSTHSGASGHEGLMTAMPLSVAHLTGHHHPGTYVQPPLPFSDTSSTTSSNALLIPMSRPGYVTLPRRPRPRMPSWASSPQPMSMSTSTDPLADDQQPLYDTIGPRVTADGSSSSALSLNKIAALGPNSPRSSTLARGHKISLPAYYVPIAEVDVPPASPLVQRQHQSSTPNMLYDHISSGGRGHQHRTPPSRPEMDMSQDASEILSPIPDFRTLPAGSRASVSSLTSNTTARRKTPPAVAPKPSSASQGIVKARPASVVPFEEESTTASSPVKVAPKPPPKPKKRPSQNGGDNFEDEGEDGTEV